MNFKSLLSQIRRVAPSLIAHELTSVQPMTGPVGNVFAMRSNYNKPYLSVASIAAVIDRLRATGFDEDAEVLEGLVAIWTYNNRNYTSDGGPR